jgi:galactose mutarotase-like enzyme
MLIIAFKQREMYVLENDFLKVSIRPKGAELTGIYNKTSQLDYLWMGDPEFWEKHSPVLFPIVGGLKNNTYFFNNRPYQLPRHGFAREKIFSITHQSFDSIGFSLQCDDETLFAYPFYFELKITYSLNRSELSVGYEVNNLMSDEMYFSIGGHPAFKVPLTPDTAYEDYFLEFNKTENSERWLVSPDGLIEERSVPFFKDDAVIPLRKELFQHDALVFKDLQSNRVSLKCTKHSHGLDFDFPGFPFMGIWAAKNADFVCIEPWCGIADNVNTDQQLKNKEGIIRLDKKESYKKEWKVSFW